MARHVPPNAEDPVQVVDTGRPTRPSPRFSIVHESDVPWQEVRAQQHGDRRVAGREEPGAVSVDAAPEAALLGFDRWGEEAAEANQEVSRQGAYC